MRSIFTHNLIISTTAEKTIRLKIQRKTFKHNFRISMATGEQHIPTC
jgi:hypothetical protein